MSYLTPEPYLVKYNIPLFYKEVYMRKVKTDNNDLIQYLETVKELKKITFLLKNTKKNIANFVLKVFLSLKRKNSNLHIPNYVGWTERRNLFLINFLMSLTLLTKPPLLLLKTLISSKRIVSTGEISLRKAMKK